MNLTLMRCAAAYSALQSLMDKEWDYSSAYALVMLKRQLQPHAEFFAEREMDLVRQFAKLDKNGKVAVGPGGSFVFRNDVDPADFSRRQAELGHVEINDELQTARVSRPAHIRADHLEALEGFLDFSDEMVTG